MNPWRNKWGEPAIAEDVNVPIVRTGRPDIRHVSPLETPRPRGRKDDMSDEAQAVGPQPVCVACGKPISLFDAPVCDDCNDQFHVR